MKGAEIALMINGFGGTPLQELYILNRAVCTILDAKKIRIQKILVGNYMTSIDMAGASVTILHLDEELKRLIAAPAYTPAIRM